ncbi:MAG TPA: hypothetical protein VL527_09835 [Dongiaceae bacterium]|jgi:hypothetical protein|nr:hypothetical protein [Dongiaceae bacterium]
MKKVFLPTMVISAVVTQAGACDFCAIYSAQEAQGAGKGFSAGVAEQFTHFGTMQQDGAEVANPADQWLDSSVTQLFVGYNFNRKFGLQFNLPVIDREFRRPDGFAIDRGSVSGSGDVSLTGNLELWHRQTERYTVRLTALGGIKLPTGDSSRIAEEFSETEVPGAPASGIHGHDLTLGSGSVDGIVGGGLFVRWQRLFATASVQYNIRTEGDYHYQFANDVSWSVAPGAYLILGEDHTLALQLVVSGEDKGMDTFQGELAEDTAMTSIYLGPELSYTWSDRLSVQAGVDLPVLLDNSALQAVPDYRIHAALTWRF